MPRLCRVVPPRLPLRPGGSLFLARSSTSGLPLHSYLLLSHPADAGEDLAYDLLAYDDDGYSPDPVYPEVEGAFLLGCYKDYEDEGALHEEFDADNTAMTNEVMKYLLRA